MFAAIRLRISTTPVFKVGNSQNFMRSPLIAVCLTWIVLVGYAASCSAQNIPTPQGVSICDDPRARGSASYDKYCGECYPRCGNTGSSQGDNGAAQAAADAAAAVAAQKHRDAEAEQQRIKTENKRHADEA